MTEYNANYLPDTAPYKDQQEYKRNQLIILDVSGGVKATVSEDVRKFVWSPDGNFLACVLGRWVEMAYESFGPHGVAIFDADGVMVKRIEIQARHLYWADYDKSLYFVTDKGDLFMYNRQSDIVERSGLRGIYLSPDGKYCFSRGGEWNDFTRQVFRTYDNEDETERLWQLVKAQHGLVGQPVVAPLDIVGWSQAGGAELIIEARKYSLKPATTGPLQAVSGLLWRKHLIIDLNNWTTAKVIEDVAAGWTSNGSVAVQRKDKSYKLTEE